MLLFGSGRLRDLQRGERQENNSGGISSVNPADRVSQAHFFFFRASDINKTETETFLSPTSGPAVE